MVSSLVQAKWFILGCIIATPPAGIGWVLLGSSLSPIPMLKVPEITVTCSIAGCQCAGTLKSAGSDPESEGHCLIQRPLNDGNLRAGGQRRDVSPFKISGRNKRVSLSRICLRDQEDAKSDQKCGCYCNAFHSFLLGSEIRTTQTSHRAQADRRFMSRQLAFTSGRLDQSRVRAAVRHASFRLHARELFRKAQRPAKKRDVGLWECSACRQHACCPLS